MSVRRLEPGQVSGGFKLEAALHIGAMAQLWRVARADAALRLLMKIPLLRHGKNPATIVGFEVEQMILPPLSGTHVPRFVAAGDFNEPYIVMELPAATPNRASIFLNPAVVKGGPVLM